MKLRYLFLLPSFLITCLLTAAPIAICETNVNVALPADGCEITLTPRMIDAGSYDTHGTIISLSLNGHQNLGPGTHTVWLIASSRSGNSYCSSQVTVNDITPPRVSCHNQTHYLVALDQGVTYNIDDMVSMSDNCEPFATSGIHITDPSDTGFGTTTFSASASDDWGNTGICIGTVTLVDAEPQNYCSSSRNAYYEHISNVSINSYLPAINQSSGADGGYKWHYPTGSNILYHGSTYTMSYSPGFRFSTTYHEYWSVYIDKNGDGDFTDSGELLHQWHGYGGNTFSFSSPGAYWGWSRIRVVMRYGGYATSPCGGGGYGETEDISVYLRPRFIFPWPNLPQEAQDAVAGQEPEAGSERPTEEALPGEAEARRQLSGPAQTNVTTSPETDIRIFPNPARAGQAVTVSGHHETTEFLLRNLAGQVVKTYPKGTSRAEIPANLPAGIYLLSGNSTAGGKPWTKRVVVR